jgi:hypothetical protein
MNLISETFTITVYNLTNKKAVGTCSRTIIYSCSLQVYQRNISFSFQKKNTTERFSNITQPLLGTIFGMKILWNF